MLAIRASACLSWQVAWFISWFISYSLGRRFERNYNIFLFSAHSTEVRGTGPRANHGMITVTTLAHDEDSLPQR